MLIQGNLKDIIHIRIMGEPVDCFYDTTRGVWCIAKSSGAFSTFDPVFLSGNLGEQKWGSRSLAWIFPRAIEAKKCVLMYADKDDPVIPYDAIDQEDDNGV